MYAYAPLRDIRYALIEEAGEQIAYNIDVAGIGHEPEDLPARTHCRPLKSEIPKYPRDLHKNASTCPPSLHTYQLHHYSQHTT